MPHADGTGPSDRRPEGIKILIQHAADRACAQEQDRVDERSTRPCGWSSFDDPDFAGAKHPHTWGWEP